MFRKIDYAEYTVLIAYSTYILAFASGLNVIMMQQVYNQENPEEKRKIFSSFFVIQMGALLVITLFLICVYDVTVIISYIYALSCSFCIANANYPTN